MRSSKAQLDEEEPYSLLGTVGMRQWVLVFSVVSVVSARSFVVQRRMAHLRRRNNLNSPDGFQQPCVITILFSILVHLF